jgi:hypothetical protein
MEFYISLILLVLLGSFCFFIARRRQRNPYIWFFIGFFFGLIGLAFLLILPKPKQNATIEQPIPLKVKKLSTPSPSLISPYKEMRWHYLDEEHKTIGPLYFSEILQAWIDGKISIKSYVWQEKMDEWKKIEEISDFKHLLEQEEIASI